MRKKRFSILLAVLNLILAFIVFGFTFAGTYTEQERVISTLIDANECLPDILSVISDLRVNTDGLSENRNFKADTTGLYRIRHGKTGSFKILELLLFVFLLYSIFTVSGMLPPFYLPGIVSSEKRIVSYILKQDGKK